MREGCYKDRVQVVGLSVTWERGTLHVWGLTPALVWLWGGRREYPARIFRSERPPSLGPGGRGGRASH